MASESSPSTSTTPEALVERMSDAVLGALELLCVYVGDQLGFYGALAVGGPATAPELAARSGTDERYTREWLEQQAVAGYLGCDNPDADADSRCYRLPDGYASVLVEPDNLMCMAPYAQFVVGTAAPLAELLQAYRSGAGVPYAHYGRDMHDGIARANRPMLTQQLAQEWVPAMPDIDARLRANPPARIADIGIGQGWSSIALARAYPNARVDGLDLDDGSIAVAEENARAAGVADRVQFHVRDAGDPNLAGQYDLALAIECIHDMANPVGALAAMRQLVGSGGTVLIVDERVPDTFAPHGDAIERMLYTASVLHCLPVGRADELSVATGTIMRRPIFYRYAEEAGFTQIDELPIENDFWRFYRLTA